MYGTRTVPTVECRYECNWKDGMYFSYQSQMTQVEKDVLPTNN